MKNTLLATLLIMFSSAAFSGGLYIGEFGQPNMGASGAGAQAIAEDASTAFQNPAGIMFLENKNDVLVTVMAVDSSIKFSVRQPPTSISPATNGGDAGSTMPAGGAFWTRKLGSEDKFGFGLALTSNSAAIMEYEDPDNFAGRYWATKVELLTITALPSFAYKVNDQWSVSFGIPVMFGNLDMDVAVPSLVPANADGKAQIKNGDDFSAAVQLGVMWQATQRLRFGLIYQSENELNFDSDLEITPAVGGIPPIQSKANVSVPFVQTVRASFASDIGDKLTILGNVAWEDWSSFKDVLISTDAGTGALPRNWDDTWHFALGLRYRTSGPWTWYTGAAYDSSPTNALWRTPDMPVDEQIRFSVGTTYATSDKFKIGGAITYADLGNAEIDNWSLTPDPGRLTGEYSTNRIVFAALNFNWK